MDMEVPDLSFQVNLNCEIAYEEFLRWFQEEWKDFDIDWKGNTGTGSTADNWIELGHEYDNYPDPKPIHLYVLVANRHNPSPTASDLDKQVAFTRLLIRRLEAKGCQVEFNGFFGEHL